MKLKVEFKEEELYVYVNPGDTIFEAAMKAGINIGGHCSGKGICGKCKVKVEGKTNQLTDNEIQLLSKYDIRNEIRLACCTKIFSDICVTVLNKLNTHKILTEGQIRIKKITPVIKVTEIKSDSLKRKYRSVEEEIIENCPFKVTDISKKALLKFIAIYKDKRRKKIAVYINTNGKIIDIDRHDKNNCCGIAFDIGTTTIVGYLVDLKTGARKAVESMLNPQIIYGDDVISRIEYSSTERGLERLHFSVVDGINKIILNLCNSQRISFDKIYVCAIVGNTCMTHIFMNMPVESLGKHPYLPIFLKSKRIIGKEYGLKMNEEGPIYILPGVSGFIGSDIIADLISSDIYKTNKNFLLVDIGTNGEVVLGTKGEIFCCSSAAGPAFEGSRIELGMRGQVGAIERFSPEDFSIKVIGNTIPQGICGSGLVDIMSGLLKINAIDKKGCFTNKYKERIFKKDGIKSFKIYEKKDKIIYITQKDIREFQTAKAAISAAIQVLLKETKLKIEELDEILIAGAFGNYLDVKSAIDVGLIPKIGLDKIKCIGNAAGIGAIKALLSKSFRDNCEEYSKKLKIVDLPSYKDFFELFIGNMNF